MAGENRQIFDRTAEDSKTLRGLLGSSVLLFSNGEDKSENKYSKLFSNRVQGNLEYKYDLIWIQLEQAGQLQKFLVISIN